MSKVSVEMLFLKQCTFDESRETDKADQTQPTIDPVIKLVARQIDAEKAPKRLLPAFSKRLL